MVKELSVEKENELAVHLGSILSKWIIDCPVCKHKSMMLPLIYSNENRLYLGKKEGTCISCGSLLGTKCHLEKQAENQRWSDF